MSFVGLSVTVAVFMVASGAPQVSSCQDLNPLTQQYLTVAHAGQTSRETEPNEHSRTRLDSGTACEMARYRYLAKAAECNPELIEAITRHHKAARILVAHPSLSEIAEADIFLCRRLAQWNDVAVMLANSPHGEHVVELDPEGMYRAIERDRSVGRAMANNPIFKRLIGDNPRLRRLIATSH